MSIYIILNDYLEYRALYAMMWTTCRKIWSRTS